MLLPKLCDKDIDTNLHSRTCCKKISIAEFQKLESKNNLKVFHNNINGLEMKLDLLQNFLFSIYFDIIAITETSLKTGDKNFETNKQIFFNVAI